MKRLIALALAALLTAAVMPVSAQTRTRWAHAHRYGDREEPRIAITVDDWYYPSTWLPQFMEVAAKYKVKMTLYPSGFNLHPEDREIWQAAIDAGHVIGSHFYTHQRLTQRSELLVKKDLDMYQKALDETLGYHYEFLSVRPPYGAGVGTGGATQVGNWIHRAGFDHIVLWDMDNTKDLQYALKKIRNGSIVLMHANANDLAFFSQLMEALQDRNYEYVTVNELLDITDRYIYVDD